ncbi:sulfate/molybdate ABC transporter ATP-binding protein [Marisediminicola sp. LYQ134]|uniref:sulfate/molybdate ABC transporter ATP-binding protein n=1 Tax=unclassified Marisediminicola TaxID=2618316 RepID=UPI0039835269
MTLSFDARLDSRGFDVAVEVAEGETLAVVGPNGAGKSTLLDLVAGLISPSDGRISLDGSTLVDSGGRVEGGDRAARVDLPSHRRGVSVLRQDALLFPHLSVLENVAFGPRSAGLGARRSREIAREWLGEVDGLALADRAPASLSGGQAQRVAVARALASDPRLLLLDEPLASLDVAAAPEIRRMLRAELEDRTALIVTHDILDALLLADRVIILDGGSIVEEGPTRNVFERPRTRFSADLAGLDLLLGTATPRGLRLDDGTLIRGEGADLLDDGAAAAAAIRSTAVTVTVGAPASDAGASGNDAGSSVTSSIIDLEPRGGLVRVRSALLSADVAPSVIVDLGLAAGMTATFSIAPEAVRIYGV